MLCLSVHVKDTESSFVLLCQDIREGNLSYPAFKKASGHIALLCCSVLPLSSGPMEHLLSATEFPKHLSYEGIDGCPDLFNSVFSPSF